MIGKFALLVVLLAAVSEAYPLHASCKIDWVFPSVTCTDFAANITAQVTKWESDDCGTGEKCLYKISSQTAAEIKGTHTTPVKKYVDDISFKMTASGSGCNVEGFSTSETWYAYLDDGTNYCNLHNLITGSTLDKATGYTETTSDDQCTQFSSANCEKY